MSDAAFEGERPCRLRRAAVEFESALEEHEVELRRVVEAADSERIAEMREQLQTALRTIRRLTERAAVADSAPPQYQEPSER